MAFTGIGKLIKDLVTGTPADTDYFAFGNTDLKKVSFPNLKKALGIDALNSALKIRISTSEFEVHEKMYDAQVYARAYNIPLKNAVEGKLIETSIDMPDSQSAWIDMANSYVYGGSSSYPITYLDYTAQNIVSPYLNFSNKKLYVMQKGDWSGYQAWIIVKYYK